MTFIKKYFQEIGKREKRSSLETRFRLSFFPFFNVANRVRVYLLNRGRNRDLGFFLYVRMNILLAERGTATTTSDIGAAMVRQMVAFFERPFFFGFHGLNGSNCFESTVSLVSTSPGIDT